jgi:uncharacterized protein YwqG
MSRTDTGSTEGEGRQHALDVLQPWVDAQTRPAWRPVVHAGEPAVVGSKFCGGPWQMAGEPTVMCAACEQPLHLLLQLDLEAIPDELGNRFGSGVLQVFYCVNEAGCSADDAWQPFSETAARVRVVPADLLERSGRAPERQAFPPLAITGWVRFDDVPDPDDHRSAGLESSYDFDQGTVTLRAPSLDFEATLGIDELGVEEIAQAADRDKLAGWPLWVQGADYPRCPTCDRPMHVVFQLGSNDHVPFMFGDMGVGHVTQCPDHHDVVAFGWSCS